MLSASRASISPLPCLSSSFLLPSAVARGNKPTLSAVAALTRRRPLQSSSERLFSTSVLRQSPLRFTSSSALPRKVAWTSSLLCQSPSALASPHFHNYRLSDTSLHSFRTFAASASAATKSASSSSSRSSTAYTPSSVSASSSTARSSSTLPTGAPSGQSTSSASPAHLPSTDGVDEPLRSAAIPSATPLPTSASDPAATASASSSARPLSASEVFASGAQSTRSDAATTDTAATTASASSSSSSTAPSIVAAINEPPQTRAQRLWARVKAECRHYWNGTKLLYADIKIAASLTRQVLNGHELSRRERKALTRTSADIIRLVPFLVIMIVPFMEFALPVLLKLFPNMLPSTYMDHKGQEAKLKKQLAAKIEMARFLQDTTQLMASQLLEKEKLSGSGADGETADERGLTVSKFQTLMSKVKRGESVKNADIVAVSRLFDEEFTLDNLNHEQLAAMCRLLDLRVFGSDWVLRYKLNKKLDELRDDDKQIDAEGVESLTLTELQEACRARGIHSGQSVSYMRRKLGDWVELSLKHDVPISLLVLSRAFSVSLAGLQQREVELSEGLAQTLKHIPDVVLEDTKESIAHQSDDVHDKLELARSEAEERKKRVQPSAGAAVPEVKKSSVVGLAEIEEQLEEIKEENDEIEEAIDTAIAKGEASKGKQQQGVAAVGAEVTAQGKEVSVRQEGKAGEGLGVERAKEKGVEKKRVETVDALNDRVEALLDRVQQELKQAKEETVAEPSAEAEASKLEKKQTQ